MPEALRLHVVQCPSPPLRLLCRATRARAEGPRTRQPSPPRDAAPLIRRAARAQAEGQHARALRCATAPSWCRRRRCSIPASPLPYVACPLRPRHRRRRSIVLRGIVAWYAGRSPASWIKHQGNRLDQRLHLSYIAPSTQGSWAQGACTLSPQHL